MSKRYFVLGMSVVLALALAVPALGGPSNPIASVSASVKKTANKALKKAKTAQKTANAARNTANSALTEAKKALTTGTAAQTSTNSVKETAESAKTTAEHANAAASAAQAAAAAAEANANTRIQSTYFEFGEATENDADASKSAGAECEGDDPILGGGFSVGGNDPNEVTVTQNLPDFLYGDSWFVTAETIEGMTATWSLQAVIMCGFAG